MEIKPQLFTGRVMHKRIFPRVNEFSYTNYYLALPLRELDDLKNNGILAVDQFGPLSFYKKDHGGRDGTDLETFARGILEAYQFNDLIKTVTLIAAPRVFGYVFNPVSFWLCLDGQDKIRAVIFEVNNTYSETHFYFCAHSDQSEIKSGDRLIAKKHFHVSPFLKREGHYQFCVSVPDNKLGIWIDYFDADGNKQLITSLVGKFQPLTRVSLRRVLFTYPFVTLKTISLIHWQAFKLMLRGVPFIQKPVQKVQNLSSTSNLTKM